MGMLFSRWEIAEEKDGELDNKSVGIVLPVKEREREDFKKEG